MGPQEQKNRTVCHVVDEHVVSFDPKDVNAVCRLCFPLTLQRRQRGIPNHHSQNRDTLFAFDRVFSEQTESVEVFQHTTKDLVTEVLNGFNCTCFAYGPTGMSCPTLDLKSKGSGKTYTMIGNASSPGVMVQTMHELFERMKEDKDERNYDVKISYLEVYNETIRDLLVPSMSDEVFAHPVRFKKSGS